MKKVMLNLATVLIGSTLFAGGGLAASYSGQDVTAYVAPSSSQTYHGTYPSPHVTAAVHPSICDRPSSGTKLKYGTWITTSKALSLPGYGTRSTFKVEDMGDVGCDKWSSYWFDIYFGNNTSYNTQRARDFGVKTVSYTTN